MTFAKFLTGLKFDQKVRSQASPWLRRELPLYKGMKKNKVPYFNSQYYPFVMLRKQAEVLITDN
ncbi:MAG: hypothetical protein F6K17_11460 [Okeania sp. SIO3C4]|nr:hypothetical protein [Okeania sp. SIO3B3]NER03197.1 hypothetical protein [Okeania sp. SIO3C4]